jgi:hypothetical protein
MHQAPALAFQVGRSRVHAYLLIALAGMGALTGALWLHPFDEAGWPQALFWSTFLLLLAVAFRQWLRWPSGELVWDGLVWHWQGTGPWAAEKGQGALRHHLDWQTGLLLSLQPEACPRIWLWAQRSDDALRWAALRRAVFAPTRLAESTPNDDAGQAINP